MKKAFIVICLLGFLCWIGISFTQKLVFTNANSMTEILINEIDYDQSGTDAQEFIELFSKATETLDLSLYSLSFINGDSGDEYRRVSLAGKTINPGEYFVVCDSLLVTNCSYDALPDTNAIQNGPGDAVILLKNDQIVDAICYGGGTVLPSCLWGMVSVVDSTNWGEISLSRDPSGISSGSIEHDFKLLCSSPGVANTTGANEQCGLPILATATTTSTEEYSATATAEIFITETITVLPFTPTETVFIAITATNTPEEMYSASPIASQTATLFVEYTVTTTPTISLETQETSTETQSVSPIPTTSPTVKVGSSGGSSHQANEKTPLPLQVGNFSARWIEQYVQGAPKKYMSWDEPVHITSAEETEVVVRFMNTGTTTWYSSEIGVYVQTDLEATDPVALRNQLHSLFGREIFATTFYGSSFSGSIQDCRASWLQEDKVKP